MTEKVGSNYWLDRWQRGDTGWHQADVEPNLISEFANLSPTRVLVPLCGQSLDLAWLASQGHEVIGIELSPIACQGFFSNQFILSKQGGFDVYRSSLHSNPLVPSGSVPRPIGSADSPPAGSVTLFNGDFFQFQPSDLERVGAVYDRAALIALSPEIRTHYVAHLKALIQACAGKEFEFLQIVLERTPSDQNGPPFAISRQDLEAYYGTDFEIMPIRDEEVDMANSSLKTPNRTRQWVYRLKKRDGKS